MIIAIYLTVSVIYAFLAVIAYIPSVKNHYIYYPLGLVLALVTNFLWLYLSKRTIDHGLITKYALIWDAIIILSITVAPLFFGVRLSTPNLIGVGLMIVGIIMIKL